MNPETLLHLNSMLLNQPAAPVEIQIQPSLPDRCERFALEILVAAIMDVEKFGPHGRDWLIGIARKHQIPMPSRGDDGIWRITE